MKIKAGLMTLLGAFAVLGALSIVNAEEPAHTIVLPSDIKWGAPPPVLPHGAEMAVLAGDPSQAGLFIVRLKFPAGYKIPAHWHPTDEHIAVVSGAFSVGMGEKLDPAKAKTLPVGGFAIMPAKMHHFAFAKRETVIDLTAMGPFQMTYVNPADNPVKASER